MRRATPKTSTSLLPGVRRGLRRPLAAPPRRVGALRQPEGVVPAAHCWKSPVSGPERLFWRTLDQLGIG